MDQLANLRVERQSRERADDQMPASLHGGTTTKRHQEAGRCVYFMKPKADLGDEAERNFFLCTKAFSETPAAGQIQNIGEIPDHRFGSSPARCTILAFVGTLLVLHWYKLRLASRRTTHRQTHWDIRGKGADAVAEKASSFDDIRSTRIGEIDFLEILDGMVHEGTIQYLRSSVTAGGSILSYGKETSNSIGYGLTSGGVFRSPLTLIAGSLCAVKGVRTYHVRAQTLSNVIQGFGDALLQLSSAPDYVEHRGRGFGNEHRRSIWEPNFFVSISSFESSAYFLRVMNDMRAKPVSRRFHRSFDLGCSSSENPGDTLSRVKE